MAGDTTGRDQRAPAPAPAPARVFADGPRLHYQGPPVTVDDMCRLLHGRQWDLWLREQAIYPCRVHVEQAPTARRLRRRRRRDQDIIESAARWAERATGEGI